MTPERWQRIDSLFDAALRIETPGRGEWLRGACNGDDVLYTEVVRLLSHDEEAAKDGFLRPPVSPNPSTDVTASWPSHPLASSEDESEPAPSVLAAPIDDPACFAPRAAIAGGTAAHLTAEPLSLSQARLRELAMIYLLIVGMMLFWRNVVLKNDALALSIIYTATISFLGSVILLLSPRRVIPAQRLKVLELSLVGMIATIFAVTQYQAMLQLSLDGDPLRAQIVMKNRVVITSILILCYGIYAPRSWRSAALVVGSLAILPFATVVLLYLRHPEALAWLVQWGKDRQTYPLALFGFDVMLLLILAVGSASGAHTIARLRRQVLEARQLGQYRLREKIGSGGMGEVYLAEHQLLKRPCALKLIRGGGVADARALERFEREVRITATLSHPNTIEIYDYGRTEDGTYYYVMEYLPGLSLADLVERHGALPPGRAVYLLRQVCLALREAHRAGLIHRDVKPSNIFAAHRGGMDDVAKLLDFGLVRPAATVREPHLSTEGHILGTPLFMSPEQATGGRELDERSDIYSLGAVAYFLLTGRPPFNQGSGIEVMIAHARDPVVPPSVLRDDIPEDLERVVMRCLEKDPDDRFPDARSLEEALSDCACATEWAAEQAAQWWHDPAHVPDLCRSSVLT